MRWGRLLAFLCVGLVLHTLAWFAYTRPVREGHKAVRADRAFFRAPPRLDLLVLGDSHPRTAIDPRLFSRRTVNLAIGGEHYLKTWYRVRKLLAATEREVDAIVLPLDPNSFSSWHAENFAPEYIWGRYVDFLEVGRVRGRPMPYLGRWVKSWVVPYAGELRTFNQMRTGRFGFGEDLPTGSFARLPETERRASAVAAARDHFQGAEAIDPGLRWAFDQLLAWADAEGIRVVLVAFPVTEPYGRVLERIGVRQRVLDEIVAPLQAEGRLYLDYHELFWGRDDLFSDAHHVNIAGRTAFSRILAQRLSEEGIVPPPLEPPSSRPPPDGTDAAPVGAD